MNVNVNVLDAQGHQLPYSAQYDPATHSVQAFLPDGTYAIQATALGIPDGLSHGVGTAHRLRRTPVRRDRSSARRNSRSPARP